MNSIDWENIFYGVIYVAILAGLVLWAAGGIR